MADGEPIEVPSARGPVRAIYHAPRRADGPVVLCVGGFDGGFDGPADGLFPALAEDLAPAGLGVMRVDFIDRRSPGIVPNGAADVTATIEELARRGVRRFGLLGHSFGAAVMIWAGARTPAVETVVCLSAQTAGATDVSKLSPRPVLFIHGLDDIRLSPDCSRYLYSLAGEPKRLVLLEGARHSLRQRAPEVRELVREWLVQILASPAAGPGGSRRLLPGPGTLSGSSAEPS
jgi:pimeloyl-ACP methyl ester carboxylesterase